MGNCLNCGKPIPEKKKGQRGRQRLHCDDVCRATYSQKKAQKGVVVPRADIESALGKPVELKWDGAKLVFEPVLKRMKEGLSQQEFESEYLCKPSNDASAAPVELVGTHEISPIKITVEKKNYNEILQAAKGGASREEIDALIAANGGLNAAQKAMIMSKIKQQ